MNDVIGNHVPLLFDFVSTGAPHVRAGEVRALATSGANRDPALPEVPTMMEAGVPDYQTLAWFAFFAPGGTPPDIVAKLNSAMTAVLAMPAVKDRLAGLGIQLTVGGPDELEALVKSDLKKWGPVVEKAGLTKE